MFEIHSFFSSCCNKNQPYSGQEHTFSHKESEQGVNTRWRVILVSGSCFYDYEDLIELTASL